MKKDSKKDPLNQLFDLFNDVMFKWQNHPARNNSELKMELSIGEIRICNYFADNVLAVFGAKRSGDYNQFLISI